MQTPQPTTGAGGGPHVTGTSEMLAAQPIAPMPQRRSPATGLLVAMLLISLAAAAAATYGAYLGWAARHEGANLRARLAALETATARLVEDLDGTRATLERTHQQADITGQVVAGVTERLAQAQTQLASLADSLAGLHGAVVSLAGQPGEAGEALRRLLEAGEGPRTKTLLYVVRPGDTLWGISRRFLGDAARYPELAARNRLADPHHLPEGMILSVREDVDWEPVAAPR